MEEEMSDKLIRSNKDVIDYINAFYDIRADHSPKIDLGFEYDDSHKITCIAGGSGTGKTTLLRKWFNVDDVNFAISSDDCIFKILNDEVGDVKQTSKLLFDVGLASVPMWKNTFNNISTGEKLRFEIAYKLASKDPVVFVDEFTSTLDRQVAKNLCLNLNKLVAKYDKNFVFCTSHFDILDWVKVDRLVDTTSKKAFSPQTNQQLTQMRWKSDLYQEICGEYLSTITI